MKNIFAIMFLISVVLSSCNPSRKAHEFADSHPIEFAGFCADNFPVKDSIYTRDSISLDTLYIESEPRIETSVISDTVFKTVYFPGTTQFITKTIRKDSVVIKRDSAAVQAKQNQINDLIVNNKDLIGQRETAKSDANRAKKSRNWWMIIALSFIAKDIIKILWKLYGGKIMSIIH